MEHGYIKPGARVDSGSAGLACQCTTAHPSGGLYLENRATKCVWARIPLATNWNVELMSQLATSVADREVVQFMRYGWSLNHDGTPTTVTLRNHALVLRFLWAMEDYISKEMELGCLLGPFQNLPWQDKVAVSPMSTRPKKDNCKCRIIMDLSWPHNGVV